MAWGGGGGVLNGSRNLFAPKVTFQEQISFYVFGVFVDSTGGVTELVIYVFGVFIGIMGGTPDKRISEGLFSRFSTKFAFNFSPIKTAFVLCFWRLC